MVSGLTADFHGPGDVCRCLQSGGGPGWRIGDIDLYDRPDHYLKG